MASTERPLTWAMWRQLWSHAIPRETMKQMVGLRTVRGKRAGDGCLDEDPDGQAFLAFYESVADDVILWNPDTGELVTYRGRAIALGEDNIVSASTYAFDANLHLYPDALSWLRDGGRGAVILDWSRAFDRLRNAPRIAVHENLLNSYREAMRPAHLPELSVIANVERLAA